MNRASSLARSSVPGVDAVVVGGSVAGLGAALALTRRGLRVACVERDATPMPDNHLQAWQRWRRDGAGQTRHSHILLAPLVNAIKRHAPDFFDILLGAGAEVLTFEDVARNTFDDPQLLPADDEIAFLACRRVVFEFLLRRYLLDNLAGRDFSFVDGADVLALKTTATSPRGSERAAGVVVKSAQRTYDIDADIVVDASGRNTRVDRWFARADLQGAALEEHPCGIFYTSRFYRLQGGVEYPQLDGRRSLAGGVAGVDLGYLKAGIFRSDNRTFSITLAADPDDAPMRAIARQREFDIAVQRIDATRPWVADDVAKPISKVTLYGNLTNSRRRYSIAGQPLLSGFFAIGDALVHTNPIAGRGCALAWVSAFDLAEAVAEEQDPSARAAAFEERIEQHLTPWFDAQVAQDASALTINKALQRGEDPFEIHRADGTVDEAARRRVVLRKGLRVASRSNIDVLRALFRQVNLLETPAAAAKRADLAAAVLRGYEQSADEDLAVRPHRDELLDAFARDRQ